MVNTPHKHNHTHKMCIIVDMVSVRECLFRFFWKKTPASALCNYEHIECTMRGRLIKKQIIADALLWYKRNKIFKDEMLLENIYCVYAYSKPKNAGTYSQRESVAFTRLVLTSPISPVLSSLPMNHSKQVTSRPSMMMRSPASKLSSSGPLPSYTSVASQIPTADLICFITLFSNSVTLYYNLATCSSLNFLTSVFPYQFGTGDHSMFFHCLPKPTQDMTSETT